MNDKKSCITGSGHGDSHRWESKGTEGHFDPTWRSTAFSCTECGAWFRHYYNRIPDIFEAMKAYGVSETCKSKKHDGV